MGPPCTVPPWGRRSTSESAKPTWRNPDFTFVVSRPSLSHDEQLEITARLELGRDLLMPPQQLRHTQPVILTRRAKRRPIQNPHLQTFIQLSQNIHFLKFLRISTFTVDISGLVFNVGLLYNLVFFLHIRRSGLRRRTSRSRHVR